MRLLLDTHALLWWLAGDRRLSVRARRAIADDDNTVLVSAASAWEISTKHRLGKLDASAVIGRLSSVLASQGFDSLDMTVDHAERAGALPGEHRDPVDRMLAAQAQAANLTLVSNDAAFDSYGVTRMW
ncbi:MAG: type II toxin-antitoxin system VapC family toxin [Gemmatimonadales bacterium]|jgi:PIN domain nuclease of toxin-antitoxin system